MDFRWNKWITPVGMILLLSAISCATRDSNKTNSTDQKVAELLTQMTLEEKVGQMAQINLTVLAKGPR